MYHLNDELIYLKPYEIESLYSKYLYKFLNLSKKEIIALTEHYHILATDTTKDLTIKKYFYITTYFKINIETIDLYKVILYCLEEIFERNYMEIIK